MLLRYLVQSIINPSIVNLPVYSFTIPVRIVVSQSV